MLSVDDFLGQKCVLRLDKDRRIKHAKLHTAGHLIAGLVDAGRGSMRAVKGYHFEEGPYVEFEGEPEDSDADAFLAALQNKINLLIAEVPQVYEAQVSYDELKQRCWNAPPNIPADKPLRTITIHSLDPVPCGGTHVRCLSEIGAVNVVKFKKRKGLTKISYRVQGV
jgi:Ser-tRNA(Ala) deacylase AlaX